MMVPLTSGTPYPSNGVDFYIKLTIYYPSGMVQPYDTYSRVDGLAMVRALIALGVTFTLYSYISRSGYAWYKDIGLRHQG